MSDKRVAVFGGFLLLDFLISVVMLGTDKNLQTDFGSVQPYYLHWYGVLGMALLDFLLGIAVLTVALLSLPVSEGRGLRSRSTRKVLVMGGLAWSIFAILAMVGIVTSYSQVGFPNMNQFAQYLFGVTPYPGALSYVPWLYDVLLAAYVLTVLAGIVALLRVRSHGAETTAA